ncbi:MAG: efflux RND transporter periplasmic adaptor subunit [Phycisphaerae bacterium]|nr:efflux RND transporter periplasmic adaptor subunit [Phycisphaerae bacterium]
MKTQNPNPQSGASNRSKRPYLVFAGVAAIAVAAVAVLRLTPAAQTAQSVTPVSPQKTAVPVVTSVVQQRTFEQTLRTQGMVEAKRFALVSARVPGTLDAVLVDEGDRVRTGQALFGVDRLKLEKALEISRRDLAVAACGLREKQANLDRVQADFDKAELDYKRYGRLFEKKAVTADVFEAQESRYKQATASLKHAHVLVELGQEQLHQAEAAVEIAEKDLADAQVASPMDGVVSERLREPGETAGPGVPVVRIVDPNELEVSAFLPAAAYGQVTVDQTLARVDVDGSRVGEIPIRYKAPTIHPKLRTFEVKGLLKDPPSAVVPGAMAHVEVLVASREGLGVPVAAVQERVDGSVVFVVREGTARQVVVTTGIESGGWIEIRQGEVQEGDAVVTLGQDGLRQGAAVQVQQEAR